MSQLRTALMQGSCYQAALMPHLVAPVARGALKGAEVDAYEAATKAITQRNMFPIAPELRDAVVKAVTKKPGAR